MTSRECLILVLLEGGEVVVLYCECEACIEHNHHFLTQLLNIMGYEEEDDNL